MARYGYAALLLYALVVNLTLLNNYVLKVARVQGRSMAPTLNDQDRLIVDYTSYLFADPQVGDTVMLRYPLNPERKFVQRIVGEEGDQIRIVNGVVFRNDQRMAEAFLAEANRSRDNWGPAIVPQGYYFVLGDNRSNSSDSRHWGNVPKKYILGRITHRWWPPFSRIE